MATTKPPPPSPGSGTMSRAYAKAPEGRRKAREAAVTAVTAAVEALADEPSELDDFRGDVLALLAGPDGQDQGAE